ncbi:MAG: BrnT family toxin [Salinibacter sp.]|uniref:BrnT family toxin n=1 Tax=Salinibacter sp. TaxID=2065818 RepID=UPI0035D41EDC
MQFEWDEEKRRANIEKHDVDFRDITPVFKNPHLTYLSPKGGERRHVAVGRLHPPETRPENWSGSLVAVVYTRRNGAYRIISARRVRDDERRAYQVLFG